MTLNAGLRTTEGMAREVSLNSLQDLEREVILQVLYRDQAVQNIEEERIRYAVPHMRASLWVFLLAACCHLLARCCLLATGQPGVPSASGPVRGGGQGALPSN